MRQGIANRLCQDAGIDYISRKSMILVPAFRSSALEDMINRDPGRLILDNEKQSSRGVFVILVTVSYGSMNQPRHVVAR
jgi:hypothetical protein